MNAKKRMSIDAWNAFVETAKAHGINTNEHYAREAAKLKSSSSQKQANCPRKNLPVLKAADFVHEGE